MAIVDSLKFLPMKYRQHALYKDVIVPILNHLLSLHEDRFDFIAGKYSNYLNISEAVATELVSEMGYQYIADIAKLDTNDIRILFGYLKLFQLLKGSKDGLNFILSKYLSGYQIKEVEWFENPTGYLDITNTNPDFAPLTRQQLMGDVALGIPDIACDPYTYKMTVFEDLSNVNFEQWIKLTN